MSDTTNGSTATEPRPDMRLELHVPLSAEGQVDATVPIRWCVSRDLIQDLERRDFTRPQLVVVVRSLGEETDGDITIVNPTETSVKVVPLELELTYVSFRRPGNNEIRVFIVDRGNKDAAEALRRLISRESGNLYNRDGSLSRATTHATLKYIELNVHVEVTVPKEMFADPPSERTKKLVRRFYPDRERDECHMRGRKIASVIQAFLLLTYGQLLKLIIVFVFMFFGGFRGMDWGELLHPWRGHLTGHVDGVDDGSVWFHDKRGRKHFSPLNLINPIVLTVVPSLVFFCEQGQANGGQFTGKHAQAMDLAYKLSFLGYWGIFWRVDLSIVALLVAIVIVLLAIGGIDSLVSMYKGSESRRQAKNRRKQESAIAERTAAQAHKAKVLMSLSEMTCTPGNGSTKVAVSALPVHKRKVSLIFSATKAKVCKPFAQ